MESFLIRSACPLERFKLDTRSNDISCLVRCLHQTSSLVYLKIKIRLPEDGSSLADEELFLSLTHSLGQPPLLPRLQYFDLYVDRPLDPGVIFTMIKSRWSITHSDRSGIARLLSAKVKCRAEADWKDFENSGMAEEYMRMLSEGLKGHLWCFYN